MYVRMIKKCKTLEDAEDTLAGWRNLSIFVLGYLSPAQMEVEGVFQCGDGVIVPGQRQVSNIWINSGKTETFTF